MPFEIFQSSKNKKFYFNLKARNGQIILRSQPFETISDCKSKIIIVRKKGTDPVAFIRKKTSSRKHHFQLQSTSLQILGMSQMYTTKYGMEKGIRSVMANAPEGQIIDLTDTQKEGTIRKG